MNSKSSVLYFCNSHFLKIPSGFWKNLFKHNKFNGTKNIFWLENSSVRTLNVVFWKTWKWMPTNQTIHRTFPPENAPVLVRVGYYRKRKNTVKFCVNEALNVLQQHINWLVEKWRKTVADSFLVGPPVYFNTTKKFDSITLFLWGTFEFGPVT